MIYTVQRAALISEQLRKFTSGYAHHLAGHFANLDFWLGEAESALVALDGHSTRFDSLKTGQQEWIKRHRTQVPNHRFCGICGGKCEFDDSSVATPPAPRNTATTAKTDARRELVNAVYYLLARYCRMGLLTEQQMQQQCDRFGTSVDPADIRAS